MNGGWDWKKFLGSFWGILAWLALSCLFGLSYLLLQTVSKPYFSAGRVISIQGDRYSTIFVVNPGPWKTRDPVIEFQLQSDIHVVDYSGGVSVDYKSNKIYAHTDAGLPAGCTYFITYKYASTNETPVLKVICDGKPCKDTPTFDMDLTLKTLLIIGGICILISAFSTVLFINARLELEKEKNSTISRSLGALLTKIAKGGGEDDVKASMAALNNTAQGLAEVAKHMRPQRIKSKARK